MTQPLLHPRQHPIACCPLNHTKACLDMPACKFNADCQPRRFIAKPVNACGFALNETNGVGSRTQVTLPTAEAVVCNSQACANCMSVLRLINTLTTSPSARQMGGELSLDLDRTHGPDSTAGLQVNWTHDCELPTTHHAFRDPDLDLVSLQISPTSGSTTPRRS